MLKTDFATFETLFMEELDDALHFQLSIMGVLEEQYDDMFQLLKMASLADFAENKWSEYQNWLHEQNPSENSY